MAKTSVSGLIRRIRTAARRVIELDGLPEADTVEAIRLLADQLGAMFESADHERTIAGCRAGNGLATYLEGAVSQLRRGIPGARNRSAVREEMTQHLAEFISVADRLYPESES